MGCWCLVLVLQLVCILTKEVERTLLIRPSFDVRPLMGGMAATAAVMDVNAGGCFGVASRTWC